MDYETGKKLDQILENQNLILTNQKVIFDKLQELETTLQDAIKEEPEPAMTTTEEPKSSKKKK